MPTNFTVVPVEGRADGDQDEAAELTEAPGAPEGHEPDCSSRGERGRTCPRDKGGAGLRGAGGGRGGRAPEERVWDCFPASPPLFRGHPAVPLTPEVPSPPSSPQSPRPSSVAGTQGEISLRCQRSQGCGSPLLFALLAHLGAMFMLPPTPHPAPRGHLLSHTQGGAMGRCGRWDTPRGNYGNGGGAS